MITHTDKEVNKSHGIAGKKAVAGRVERITIGKITYLVSFECSPNATESLEEILIRLILQQAEQNADLDNGGSAQ